MRRIWYYLLTNRTMLGVIGLVVVSSFILLSARTLHLAMIWAIVLAVVIVVVWTSVWFVRRRRAQRAAKSMDSMLQQDSERAVAKATPAKKTEVEAVRKRFNEAIGTLRTSKLGEVSGRAALYELPWYVVIGNPAAGKSSAVINSGLHFPFAEKGETVVQGIGGTRNCDWFFTTEGILLDTAGRYAVHEEDRGEWLGFLHLLKRNRPKAPINGILIVASVPELTRNRPEFVINLAKQIRERVQEITSQLEVFAPVYVMFTKVDLIAGFVEFFEDSDSTERGRVWGATLPYDAEGKADPVAAFDDHFDKIFDGLKEMSIERMALYRGEQLGPGVLTFPVEFAGIRPTLRAFLATLFEENPFQFKPIFRGFYFTSALQEGQAEGVTSERIAERFGLKQLVQPRPTMHSAGGYFLRDLFSRVVFADRNLVRQYSSRGKRRLRLAAFAGSVVALGLFLGILTWSFIGNQRLVENVQADLDKAIKLQEGRIDLASRIEALEILQDRLEQMERYREDAPLALSMGLFQGDRIEAKLRAEYFAGINQIMLKPVAESLEGFLSETNRRAAELKPMAGPAMPGAVVADAKPEARDEAATTQYKEASPVNVQDAYNALKTYLMLADHEHTEPGHLTDQLTRFWRGWLESNRGVMPREQMIRSAERLMSFTVNHAGDADFPTIDTKLVMADQARENLRRVVRGMAARDRVYAEVRARASTRFPAMTVARIVGEEGKDLLSGSYAIPGTFTRDAWEQYIEPAFKEAANKELQTTDWVLKTSARDDLSLEGSPEQIQKALAQMYKTEYVQEWQKFLVGIAVNEFKGFDDAVSRMNLLGDPARSPLARIMQTTYRETSWDNPSLLNQGLQDAQRGVIAWFRRVILRQAPAGVEVTIDASGRRTEVPMGPIGREFSGIAGLMVARGSSDASLYKGYLDALSKVRTRFNQMKNAGDPGPASRQLMQQTLEGSGSELADALKYVDEQMLNGMSDASKAAVRPLLVRPLMMAYAVTVKPTEAELNKIWNAQVFEPFQRILSEKYPFAPHAGVEASAAETGQIFGPEGAIAKFVQTTMGPLVVRRGDSLTARTWAEMGIQLQPEFADQFPRYVAPLAGGAATGGGGGGGGAEGQTVFQIKPRLVSGLSEYTIEIDGQVLRYRMGAQEWTNFVWPSVKGQPGARITAVTYDGRVVEITNQPGRYGLERLINTAQRAKKPDGVFELTWNNGGSAVSVDLRIVSSPQAPSPQTDAAGGAPTKQSLLGLKLPQNVAGGA